MMLTITAFVAPIMLFGFVCIANGIWQIVTGRRNIWIMVVVFAFAFLLIVVAEATTGVLDRKKDSGKLMEITNQIESNV